MISNCLAYNNKDTVFYRAGLKMRDQVSVVDFVLVNNLMIAENY